MSADTTEKTETHAPRPDLGVPRYKLVNKTAGDERFEPVALIPGITYVGRVKGNDVVVESELVSRRHAKIILTDMGVTVHDLDSHNGVFLNGKKVRSTPLSAGDLVYFGDVCCTLVPNEDEAPSAASIFDADINQSSLVSDASSLSATDDPAVRSLATLIQATDLLLGAGDDAFFGDVLELCRALVSANLAVLVKREGDELEISVVLREVVDAEGEPPIRWPLVRKAVEDHVVFFSHEDGSALLAADAAERAAVMCVPIVASGEVYGALYFSRPNGSRGYTERDVETLSAVAHIVGVRMGGRSLPARARAEDMDTSISALQAPPSDTSEEAARAALDRLQGDVDRLTQDLDQAQQRRQRLEEERDAQAVALDEARMEIGRLEDERAALETARSAELGDGEERLQAVSAQLEAKTAGLATASAELERMSAARTELEGRARALEAQLFEREREAEEQRAAHASVEQRLEQVSDELKGAREAASAAAQQVEALDLQLVAAKNEMQRLVSELARHDDAAALDAQRSEALQKAVLAALPETLSTRVLSLASGDDDSPLLVGDRTAVCVSLGGFDAWAVNAAPTDVQERLNFFCARVRAVVSEQGGTLEQVLGHAHLALFDADQEGVLAAARCATQLARTLRAESGVQVGLHVGSVVLGFFGAGNASVRAAAGEVIAVSKGAAESGQPGSVMVSESVRSKIPADSGMMLVNCGPHIIRGMPQPITLYQLMTSGES